MNINLSVNFSRLEMSRSASRFIEWLRQARESTQGEKWKDNKAISLWLQKLHQLALLLIIIIALFVDQLTLISIPSLHLAAFYNANGAATSWHDRQQRCEARDSADFRWKTTRQNESRMIYDARAWHVLRIIYSSNFSSLFLLFHFLCVTWLCLNNIMSPV